MHDLWPKVVEETKTRNSLELCSWQRWEITQANHNFECDYKSCFTLIFIKKDTTLGNIRDTQMIPVYQYLNQQSLTVTSVQQHVPTPPSRFLSLSFPLNLEQWCQQSQVRLIKEKHLFKRQKQLYAITEVRWNSGPQMVMHCPKYRTILLIADSVKNNK